MATRLIIYLCLYPFILAMVDEAAVAVSEYVYVYAFCDACNNVSGDDVSEKKAMAGAAAEAATVAIMLLARLTPQLLPL